MSKALSMLQKFRERRAAAKAAAAAAAATEDADKRIDLGDTWTLAREIELLMKACMIPRGTEGCRLEWRGRPEGTRCLQVLTLHSGAFQP